MGSMGSIASARVAAFAGLFLVLGVSFGSSHPLGIALALAAALSRRACGGRADHMNGGSAKSESWETDN